MRRVRQGLDRAELAACERMIKVYAPYVLVRCTRYTNRRRQAQQIGVYTLITTCLLARGLEHGGQLGKIVDTMAGVVGRDVVSGREGKAWWGDSDELLIVNRRMRQIAAALNSLRRPRREVLVLHHVAGLEVGDLARLLQRLASEVVAEIGRAERLLARRLGGSRGGGRGCAVLARAVRGESGRRLDRGGGLLCDGLPRHVRRTGPPAAWMQGFGLRRTDPPGEP